MKCTINLLLFIALTFPFSFVEMDNNLPCLSAGIQLSPREFKFPGKVAPKRILDFYS